MGKQLKKDKGKEAEGVEMGSTFELVHINPGSVVQSLLSVSKVSCPSSDPKGTLPAGAPPCSGSGLAGAGSPHPYPLWKQ